MNTKPQEIPLKQWRCEEAKRLGISPRSVAVRMSRGKYPELQTRLRRVNARTIFVRL